MRAELAKLKGRSDLVGPALRRELVTAADSWLAELFGDPGPGLALIAVGGYGRLEPALASDLDLVLLHEGRRRDVAEVADRLWYAVWDSGIGLDHSVRTQSEARGVAAGDLRAALGLLDARLVAGDAELATKLVGQVRSDWRSSARKRLPELAAAVSDRATTCGEIAFLLEPDIKEARGGLRDIEALRALALAQVAAQPGEAVVSARDVLLDVRGELHRRTGRDALLLQEQESVAQALGIDGGADGLAREVATAGRSVAWAWDTAWHRAARAVTPPRRLGGRRSVRRPLDVDVVEQDGEVVLATAARPAEDPGLVLRVARAAAHNDLVIAPYTLERLATECPPLPVPWPPSARDDLVGTLAAGPAAVSVLESLDQVGLLVRLLPEWANVQTKPQRNPYHRFTVDRHLLEAAAGAAGLTRRVARPDLLLLGALLHDIGKGRPGDHTEVGIELVRELGPAMGLPRSDVEVLVALVRHHLLLPDVATRRDLDDTQTIERVAGLVGDALVLDLLAALAEADGRATGATAWTPWKAGLVADLHRRVAAVLRGSGAPPPPEPGPEDIERLRRTGGVAVEVAPDGADGATVVVTAPDQVGLFAAISGVAALHRLDVRRASARSVKGRAVTELAVGLRYGRDLPSTDRFARDVQRALDGELVLTTKLDEQEQLYARRRKGPEPAAAQVRFDDVPADATVVEVRAPDGAGVLHRVVSALTACDLDVRTALVSTLGVDVVDAFYVTTTSGEALPTGPARERVAREVLAALA